MPATNVAVPSELPQDVKEWNEDEVETFLTDNKKKYLLKDEHIKAVKDQEIGGRYLLGLTVAELQSIKLGLGPAKGIVELVDELKAAKGLKPGLKRTHFLKKPTVHPLFEAYETLGIDRQTHLSKLSEVRRLEMLRNWPRSWPSNSYTSFREVAAQYKNAGKEFPTTGFINNEESFPIVKSPTLYIREYYPTFYKIVTDIIKRGNIDIAITGTPGIGKSCFLIYFILRLLHESTNDKPNIVIFQPTPNKYYCYYGTESVLVGSFDNFEHLLELPDIWYLSDSEEGPETENARTIITLTPKDSDDRFPKFHVFFKNLATRFCMPLWTPEEISDCRKEIFPNLNENVVSELFHKVGGVPRSVYLCHRRIQNVLLLLAWVASRTIQLNTQLLHLIPKPPPYLLEDPHREWASGYVLAEFSRILENDSIEYLMDTVARRTARDPKENHFELLVTYFFRRTAPYDYRRIGGGQAGASGLGKLELQTPVDFMKFQHRDGLKDVVKDYLKRLEEGGRDIVEDQDRFLLLSSGNFHAIDLIRWPKTRECIELFQIATSKDYPIKLDPLKEIMQVLKSLWSISQFRLVFVVPNELMADYPLQSYLGPKGGVVRGQGDECVTQWVLGINLRDRYFNE